LRLQRATLSWDNPKGSEGSIGQKNRKRLGGNLEAALRYGFTIKKKDQGRFDWPKNRKGDFFFWYLSYYHIIIILYHNISYNIQYNIRESFFIISFWYYKKTTITTEFWFLTRLITYFYYILLFKSEISMLKTNGGILQKMF
jgi:hypothetical protein